jgi:hypothetical protein
MSARRSSGGLGCADGRRKYGTASPEPLRTSQTAWRVPLPECAAVRPEWRHHRRFESRRSDEALRRQIPSLAKLDAVFEDNAPRAGSIRLKGLPADLGRVSNHLPESFSYAGRDELGNYSREVRSGRSRVRADDSCRRQPSPPAISHQAATFRDVSSPGAYFGA